MRGRRNLRSSSSVRVYRPALGERQLPPINGTGASCADCIVFVCAPVAGIIALLTFHRLPPGLAKGALFLQQCSHEQWRVPLSVSAFQADSAKPFFHSYHGGAGEVIKPISSFLLTTVYLYALRERLKTRAAAPTGTVGGLVELVLNALPLSQMPQRSV